VRFDGRAANSSKQDLNGLFNEGSQGMAWLDSASRKRLAMFENTQPYEESDGCLGLCGRRRASTDVARASAGRDERRLSLGNSKLIVLFSGFFTAYAVCNIAFT
jgi:hypothetical protein